MTACKRANDKVLEDIPRMVQSMTYYFPILDDIPERGFGFFGRSDVMDAKERERFAPFDDAVEGNRPGGNRPRVRV